MKKLFILCLLFTGFFCNDMSAQAYKTAVGLRLGSPSGPSIKHFISEKSAVEAFAGVGYRNFSIGAAYLYHQDVESVDNLRWYAGLGAGAIKGRGNYYRRYTGNSLSVGGQVYGGLDYKFEDLPISVTFDVAPGIYLGGWSSGIKFLGGFGVRYVLGEGGLDL